MEFNRTISRLRRGTKRAAEQGFAPAELQLDLLYDYRDGVTQDFAEAAGLPRAQFNLGTMYANGQGVAVNLVKSYFWLGLAAKKVPKAGVVSRHDFLGWLEAYSKRIGKMIGLWLYGGTGFSTYMSAQEEGGINL